MKREIEKLKAEYNGKIKDEDTRLELVNAKIGEIRRNSNCKFYIGPMDLDSLRQEKHIINARRQAYVQAKSDIDSLLDYA